MGVEYRHFLIPADPAWLPEVATASRVDAVLRRWSLVAAEPELFDLSGNVMHRLSRGVETTGALGAGLAIVYPGVEGPAVPRIVGPSCYAGVGANDRYLMGITLVVGLDYRIHLGDESLEISLRRPPNEGDRLVVPYPVSEDHSLYDEAFPATAETSPPSVTVGVDALERHHLAWDRFSGYWRAALILDSGKDLPSFVGSIYALPSREFLREMGEAFRAELLEVGNIY